MTLSYETAVRLRESGFPQKPPFPFSLKSLKKIKAQGKDPKVYFPTLEELIEACGPIVLHGPGTKDVNEEYYTPSETKWVAFKQSEEYGNCFGDGDTPTEAVAALYLALHKPELLEKE